MSASLTRLQSFYGELKAQLLLHAMIKREFPGTAALLTAFTADAGILLSMVAEIDPTTPILCLEPRENAAEIHEYGRSLAARFGLTRIRWVTPASGLEPLADVLDETGILALITGRSGGGLRRIALDASGVFRIHPLAGWSEDARRKEMEKLSLPAHPLGANAGTETQALAVLPEAIDAPAVSAVDWHV